MPRTSEFEVESKFLLKTKQNTEKKNREGEIVHSKLFEVHDMKSLLQKVRGKQFWNIQAILRISMIQGLDCFLVFIRYIATAKRLWCWEGLGAGGKGDDRGWDGWWHHRLDGNEFEWTPGVGDGQGGLVCCDSGGCKESDMAEWTELNWRCIRK